MSTTFTPPSASALQLDSHNNIVTAIDAAPPTPVAGVTMFGRSVANRTMLAMIDTTGDTNTLQATIARNKVGLVAPVGNSNAAPPAFGIAAPTPVGTATARSVATTNLAARTRRIGYVSSTTAGALAGIYWNANQFSAGSGSLTDNSGFWSTFRFVPSDAAAVSGERMFVGWQSNTSAPTNVEPNTLTNCIGIARLSTDATQLYLVYGGSTAQTAIALGATNFPAGTLSTVGYEFAIYAPGGIANTFYIQITNLATNATYSTTLTGAAAVIPQSTTLLAPRMWVTNNATALASGIDLISLYVETDN